MATPVSFCPLFDDRVYRLPQQYPIRRKQSDLGVTNCQTVRVAADQRRKRNGRKWVSVGRAPPNAGKAIELDGGDRT